MIDIYDTGYNNIREIEGISDDKYWNDNYDSGSGYNTKQAMRGVCYTLRKKYKRIVKIPFTTMIFTGVVNEKYPGNLSRLIKNANLGEVMATNERVNPNSDNIIKVYIWHIDKKRLSQWFTKNRMKPEDFTGPPCH